MAKKEHDSVVQSRIKVGSPRTPKKGKGNAPARSSRSGNGKKIR